MNIRRSTKDEHEQLYTSTDFECMYTYIHEKALEIRGLNK